MDVDYKRIVDIVTGTRDNFDTFQKNANETLAGIRGQLDGVIDRVEDLEAKGSMPGRPGGAKSAEAKEHEKLFLEWMRKPRSSETNRKLSEFEMQTKSVSIGTGSDGGYAVPEEIGRRIVAMQLKYSPVRSLVTVDRSNTSDLKRLVDLTGASGGWRSETGSVTETNTSSLREVTPTGGEIYAYPKTTEWALDDVFFDVAGWLVNSVSRKFAQLEGVAVISGNGTNQPTGMLNTTPVTTSDDASPKRAAAAFQYVLGSDNSPASIDTDGLNDLIYTTNSAYRSGAAWAMNSTSAGQISKLKDSTGRPLWQPSLQVGQPPVLLGYPVAIWEQMPDPLGGNFPVGFGDWSQAYNLIDRTDLRITVDNITAPGWVKYYVRRRLYGHVSNNDAVKFLKLL